MAIQGFDYKTFAQNLTEQAFQLVPQDFNDAQKSYVGNTLLNFSTIAGEALYNDTESNFNLDQAVMITQIIAEWSFHKSVDLVRSGLPQQFWDPIMQKIAFTIFEVAKQAFKQGLPQDQILQLIEHHVKKSYADAIAELKEKNLIDDGLMEQATNQSNIDAMMQQAAQMEQEGAPVQETSGEGYAEAPAGEIPQQQTPQNNPKILKLATLALLFKQMKQEKVQAILDKFSADDAQSVIKFMQTPDLQAKVDPNTAIRCLQEIKTSLPGSEQVLSPSKILKKVQNISNYMDRPKLEQFLQFERPKVKRFIFNALEGEYYEIAPRVANLIAAHIEDSI
ncbi:MAG: hypothetical protein LBJ74_01590 [Heliobacteriaceae bacterium]|nr:hypothetical protein [Heliobacteriaceae bacterium]